MKVLPQNREGSVLLGVYLVLILIILPLLPFGCTTEKSNDNPVRQLQVDFENPLLPQILLQIDPDTLKQFVRDLSGENPVVLQGSTVTIRSRHSDYPGNDLAADYIQMRLEGYGLTVTNQTYSTTGRNVLAVLNGSVTPGESFILCAHYDAMPDNSLAPGADDNASGVATVLEAARILSGYSVGYSVVLAFWDEEEDLEVGFLGSSHYASGAQAAGDVILGVLNVDAIGWDSDNDRVVQIDTQKLSTSSQLYQIVTDVNTVFQIGMSVMKVPDVTGSDFVSFWENGFGAIGIEEWNKVDSNPARHSVDDRIVHFSDDYFLGCAQLVITTLATLVGVGQ